MYMKEFGLRPIVLIRNIFDVVPSLVDHHTIENHIYPSAWAPTDIASRSFEEQAHFVTQMAIPWYFNFFMSWQDCEDKLLVHYEDLVAEPGQVLRRVCAHFNIEVSSEQIAAAIERASTNGRRKNKVAPGRGKMLPPEDIAAIVKMSNHYPHVDFTPIGITHPMRQMQSGCGQAITLEKGVFWLTGLPGAGKTTLARAFKERLDAGGVKSIILDGDELRCGINSNLGFSEIDRNENVRRVAEIASLFERQGYIVIVALVSPMPEQRKMARLIIGERFTEVYIDTPLEICESRDPKGHYLRARQGRIGGFTGVSAPYIPSEAPDVVLHAGSITVEQAIDVLLGRPNL